MRSSNVTPTARRIVVAVVALMIAAAMPSADAGAASFKRGASMVEFFSFSATTGEGAAKSYVYPAFPKVTAALLQFNFDDLRKIGFDHMRVPIDLGPLMRGDEIQRRTIIDQLQSVIAVLHRSGLGVLVTAIPPQIHQELPETYLDGLKGPKFSLYFEIVERIAAELGAIKTGLVALEPMNEPQSECRAKTGLDWTSYQEFMVERIRAIAPNLPLFLTGACWSNIEGIVLLDSDLLRDRRNFVSVHFYYPFLFTHQAAHWSFPYIAGTIGVPYPASAGTMAQTLAMTRERFKTVPLKAGVDRIEALGKAEREIAKYFREEQGPAGVDGWMKRVADWQKREGVHPDQIVFTEFGAMKQLQNGVEIEKSSRARWLHDASSAIERNGWGWNIYVLRDDPFGIYVRETDRYPDPDLLRALRLKKITNE
jgi:endoglucanase